MLCHSFKYNFYGVGFEWHDGLLGRILIAFTGTAVTVLSLTGAWLLWANGERAAGGGTFGHCVPDRSDRLTTAIRCRFRPES